MISKTKNEEHRCGKEGCYARNSTFESNISNF